VTSMEPDPEQGGDPPCWAAQFEQPQEDDAEHPEGAEDDGDPPD
jgi:hypothetical protein